MLCFTGFLFIEQMLYLLHLESYIVITTTLKFCTLYNLHSCFWSLFCSLCRLIWNTHLSNTLLKQSLCFIVALQISWSWYVLKFCFIMNYIFSLRNEKPFGSFWHFPTQIIYAAYIILISFGIPSRDFDEIDVFITYRQHAAVIMLTQTFCCCRLGQFGCQDRTVPTKSINNKKQVTQQFLNV